MKSKKSFLCVANWDSNVGYAWWLMESFWAELAKNLGDEFNVILAYPSISEIPDPISDSGINTVLFDFNEKGVQGLIGRLKFIWVNNIGVIYFSDKKFFSVDYFLYRIVGVKIIIVHDHTPGVRDEPHGLKKILKCVRARLPWFNADAVIGATEFVKNRIMKVACVPGRKTYSAPNGIPEPNRYRAGWNVYQRFGINPGKRIIVSVGRLTFYKGVDFTLQVMRTLIREKGQNKIHYLHIGDGPDREKLQKMIINLGLEKHVTFGGKQKNIHEILKSCYLAFHPSRGEVGYSLSILEYMQAGLPVVVPDNPSVCEATQDEVTGKIYKNESIESACENIIDLLNNEEKKKRMSENAIRKLGSSYSLGQCLDTFNSIISKIVYSM